MDQQVVCVMKKYWSLLTAGGVELWKNTSRKDFRQSMCV